MLSYYKCFMLEWLVCGVSFHKEDTLAQCSPWNSFFISEFFFYAVWNRWYHKAQCAGGSRVPHSSRGMLCLGLMFTMGIWPSNFCCKLSTQEEQLFYSTLQITGNYNWNDPSETLLVSSNSGRCIFLMDLSSCLNSIAHILLTMYWTGSWYCRCQPRRIWIVEPEYYWWKWPRIFFGSRRCGRCESAELQHISGRIS